jgi:hypothetical protein
MESKVDQKRLEAAMNNEAVTRIIEMSRGRDCEPEPLMTPGELAFFKDRMQRNAPALAAMASRIGAWSWYDYQIREAKEAADKEACIKSQKETAADFANMVIEDALLSMPD